MQAIDLNYNNLLTLEEIEEAKVFIKDFIQSYCLYVPNPDIQYHPSFPKGRIPPKIDGSANGMKFLYLLRRVMYNPKVANAVYLLFIDEIIGLRREGILPEDFQIGGIEASSIALLSGLQQTMVMLGMKAPNIITMRKDRKPFGLFQFADGKVENGPVLFIDDIIHSGKSFYRFADVVDYELKLEIVPVCFCILTFIEEEIVELNLYENQKAEVRYLFNTNEFDYAYNPIMEESLGDDILWKKYSGWKNTDPKQ